MTIDGNTAIVISSAIWAFTSLSSFFKYGVIVERNYRVLEDEIKVKHDHIKYLEKYIEDNKVEKKGE